MTDPLAISENENAKGTQAELKNCTILHNDDDFSRVRVGRWVPKKNAKGTQAGSKSSRIKKMQASDACCSNLFSEQPTTLRFLAAGMRTDRGASKCTHRQPSSKNRGLLAVEYHCR